MKTTMTAILVAVTLVFTLFPASEASTRKGRHYFERRGDAVWDAPTGRKAIALTFDDGPDPLYTPQLLDILKQNHAHATFFVVGSQAERHPSVVKREVAEGNEVENHTYTHPNLRRKPPQVIQKEIGVTAALIASITQRRTTFFRPPGGYYNEQIIEVAKQEGCKVVLWSWDEDSKDWTDPGTLRIVKRVVQHADDGDIVLLHDRGGKRRQTVQAVNTIIPLLQAQGFQFVTVSQLLQMRNR